MNAVKGVFLKEKEKFVIKWERIFWAFRGQAGGPTSHQTLGKDRHGL